jgi:hypothetical protein
MAKKKKKKHPLYELHTYHPTNSAKVSNIKPPAIIWPSKPFTGKPETIYCQQQSVRLKTVCLLKKVENTGCFPEKKRLR